MTWVGTLPPGESIFLGLTVLGLCLLSKLL